MIEYAITATRRYHSKAEMKDYSYAQILQDQMGYSTDIFSLFHILKSYVHVHMKKLLR